ncbi:3-methyl-2-oxobutanoate dehydrogenase subunit VorB [Anoxybacter fermentans]|uniref:3-methyl-2-oxobutanoate dehydrogenase subunit VorB n=1 Tax=Anoxybacter fermentans TaxID=1323375 RepID=A0A3Q9HQH4_9FIRM|nr:3-methyl-2-oxobutanoate dehydrogenase subunit VorB [Anoxybacter fermentans]AZR73442.1 3-methyl-2-oxobutanoate dehydrogenase subunit VorB [Anoxybacter fermentans]
MGERILMKGNEAIGEAAIKAGCRYFFGYPITPQNELPEYMSRRLPEVGGVFLQAESEVAAINMVYGAAGAGARVMTSSSSPGISLKMEGISYIAGADLPCVIVNIVRGGPGLGGIQPAQSDYFQATKGGGHGDYHMVVLAPSSIQEAVDLVMEAFDIADQYRVPVMVIGDGMIGQMMEPVEFKEPPKRDLPAKDWITDGCKGRKPNVINSLSLQPEKLEEMNWNRYKRYEKIKENEVKVETINMEDAEIALVAYGTTSRICFSAMETLREEGYKVGLIRPITLWPFPTETISKAADNVKAFLTVEMSTGQMVEDVRLAVNGKVPVHFYGRTGGMVPSPDEIIEQVKALGGGK